MLWTQYFPTDPDLLEWMFGAEVREGHIKSPFDIADVWPSSYSANTNEILWGAKVAARVPWIAGVIRLASYECGMDQPTYTPVQQIVERSGTLFFSFQELDSTKPAGLGEDPRRDDRALPAALRRGDHRAEEGGVSAGLPASSQLVVKAIVRGSGTASAKQK